MRLFDCGEQEWNETFSKILSNGKENGLGSFRYRLSMQGANAGCDFEGASALGAEKETDGYKSVPRVRPLRPAPH